MNFSEERLFIPFLSEGINVGLKDFLINNFKSSFTFEPSSFLCFLRTPNHRRSFLKSSPASKNGSNEEDGSNCALGL